MKNEKIDHLSISKYQVNGPKPDNKKISSLVENVRRLLTHNLRKIQQLRILEKIADESATAYESIS